MRVFIGSVLMLAAANSAVAQERQWSFGELLRNIHVAAYVSPGICSASDEIALYTLNTTGLHSSEPETPLSELTYRIVGRFPDGRVVALADDENKIIPGSLEPRVQAIRCVNSAARAQGATDFAIIIQSARVGR